MRKQILVGLCVGALGMTAAACSSVSESVAENVVEELAEQEGISNVEIDTDEGSVSIDVETEDGTQSVEIGTGSVPDDFPAPVPSGGSVVSAISAGGSGSGWTLIVEYEGDRYEEMVGIYEPWLESEGYEIQKFEQTAPIRSLQLTGTRGDGDEGALISIGVIEDITNVTLIISS